jgi:site-specific recombinase XerD
VEVSAVSLAVRLDVKLFPVTSDFDAAINAFILSRHLKNLSSQTTDWYRRRLKPFAEFCQQRNETPSIFSRETVLAYLNFRLQHWTPQTVNGDLRTIKAFSPLACQRRLPR